MKIVTDEVEHLDGDALMLKSGHRIQSDAIICATGYQYGLSFPMFPEDKRPGWGVPVLPSQDTIFGPLEKKADNELLARFPALSTSPAATEKDPGLTS